MRHAKEHEGCVESYGKSRFTATILGKETLVFIIEDQCATFEEVSNLFILLRIQVSSDYPEQPFSTSMTTLIKWRLVLARKMCKCWNKKRYTRSNREAGGGVEVRELIRNPSHVPTHNCLLKQSVSVTAGCSGRKFILVCQVWYSIFPMHVENVSSAPRYERQLFFHSVEVVPRVYVLRARKTAACMGNAYKAVHSYNTCMFLEKHTNEPKFPLHIGRKIFRLIPA